MLADDTQTSSQKKMKLFPLSPFFLLYSSYTDSVSSANYPMGIPTALFALTGCSQFYKVLVQNSVAIRLALLT